MNEKQVRTYLLENISLDEKRSMGEFLLYCRNGGFLILLFGLIATFLSSVLDNYSNAISKTGFVLLLGLVPINIFLAFRRYRMRIVNWESIGTKSEIHSSSNPFFGLAFVLGMWFFRNLYGEILVYVSLLGLSFLSIFSSYFFSVYAYKLFLLKKYCPDLMDYRPASDKK